MHCHRMAIVTIIVLLISPSAAISQKSPRKSKREVVSTDVIYGHKAGMALTFDIYWPRQQNGAAVISIVSSGWRSSWDLLQQFTATPDGSLRLMTEPELAAKGGLLLSHSYLNLLQKGFTVFAVRHGSIENFEMSEIVADLRRAIRFIRFHASDYGIDSIRIGLWGGSAGGHLSLLLGTTAEIANPNPTDEFERGSGKVAAVVAYSPPTDFPKLAVETGKKAEGFQKFLRMDSRGLTEFSPIQHISADDPPALIIHGDKDTGTPINQGKSMYEALKNAGVVADLFVIQGAGHGFFEQDARLANDQMVRWFQRYLLKQ